MDSQMAPSYANLFMGDLETMFIAMVGRFDGVRNISAPCGKLVHEGSKKFQNFSALLLHLIIVYPTLPRYR